MPALVAAPAATGRTVALDVAARVVARGATLGVPLRDAADELAVAGTPRAAAPTAPEAPAPRVRFERLLEVWAAIATRGGDLAPSLTVAAGTRIEDFHVLGFTALTAPTIADALAHLPRLGALITDAGRWRVRAAGGATVSVEWERLAPALAGRDLATESSLAHVAHVMRQLAPSARPVVPVAVSFAHAAPRTAAARAAYERFFGCRVAWSAPLDALVYPTAALSATPQLAHPAMHAYVRAQAESLADAIVADLAPRAADRAARLLAARLAVREGASADALRLEPVARALGLTARTLRRRLADEGVAFRALVDTARRERAAALLAAGRRSLAEVAFALGFADQAALTHACVRWFGAPPSRLRGVSVAPNGVALGG